MKIKTKKIIKKHGINFEYVKEVFGDPHMLSWLDGRFEYGEERWIGLGAITNVLIIVIIHTYRRNSDGEEVIRIISARKADKKEQEKYFNQHN